MDPNSPRPGLRRRDAAGHLDPRYAAELRDRCHENEIADPRASAFVQAQHSTDELAEQLGESLIQAATSAEDCDDDTGDALITGEIHVPEGELTEFESEDTDELMPESKPRKPGTATRRRVPASGPKRSALKSNAGKPQSTRKPAKAKLMKSNAKQPKSTRKASKRKAGRKVVARKR